MLWTCTIDIVIKTQCISLNRFLLYCDLICVLIILHSCVNGIILLVIVSHCRDHPRIAALWYYGYGSCINMVLHWELPCLFFFFLNLTPAKLYNCFHISLLDIQSLHDMIPHDQLIKKPHKSTLCMLFFFNLIPAGCQHPTSKLLHLVQASKCAALTGCVQKCALGVIQKPELLIRTKRNTFLLHSHERWYLLVYTGDGQLKHKAIWWALLDIHWLIEEFLLPPADTRR